MRSVVCGLAVLFRVWSGRRVGLFLGSVFRLVGAPFFGFVCGDGEKCVCEHGEGDMSMPGVPGADLIVVESGFVLG